MLAFLETLPSTSICDSGLVLVLVVLVLGVLVLAGLVLVVLVVLPVLVGGGWP